MAHSARLSALLTQRTNIQALVVYFLFYSFIGWIVDTAARSYASGHYEVGNFLPILPLCPLYGFGALLVLTLAPHLSKLRIIWQWCVYALLLATLEYTTGTLLLFFTHQRSWGYPPTFLSLNGFTDPAHAMLWGSLALILNEVVHPYVKTHVFLMVQTSE